MWGCNCCPACPQLWTTLKGRPSLELQAWPAWLLTVTTPWLGFSSHCSTQPIANIISMGEEIGLVSLHENGPVGCGAEQMEKRRNHRTRTWCGKEFQEVSGSKARWGELQTLAILRNSWRKWKYLVEKERCRRFMTAFFAYLQAIR